MKLTIYCGKERMGTELQHSSWEVVMIRDWSAHGLLEWEGHAVCLYKIKHGVRTLIGLPGGRKNRDEIDPLQTFIREVFEETGIVIYAHQVRNLRVAVWRSVRRRNSARGKIHIHRYRITYYHVDLTPEQFQQRRERCDEGEIIVIETQSIRTRRDFQPSHCEALLRADVFEDEVQLRA
jgi:8-oxo-dGTP pyrophosphatase MutT (NUDIX family)